MSKLPRCCWTRSTFFVLSFPVLVSALLPKVDFDRMGHVGLAGNFAGLDLFDSTNSLSFDPTASTLLTRATDGSLSTLGSTEAGGKINAGCASGNTIYIAGLFTSINGTSASNIVTYSPSSGVFSALGSGGPNGEIKSIFCDTSNHRVWVGGSFSSPGKAVAVWDTGSRSWSPPPFTGLSGAATEVLSITTNSSAKSLFFAGSFITAFGTNSSLVNGSNNPNVPFSSGATPFSSSLVPIPLQGAQVIASPSTSDPQFSDINTILCPSGPDGPGSTWFAANGSTAVITVREFAELNARGIRLGNTFLANHGTTAFSLTSIPDNIVRTLTFVDPTSGENQTCTNSCPLLQNSSVPYQDFLFNDRVQLTGFQLTLSNWVGSSAGLHLMQLLSSGAFASAVVSRNQLSCFAPNASSVSLIGQWTEQRATTDIAGTTQDILVANVNVGTTAAEGPSITWMPYVSASGNYGVNLLIPGCSEFQDCASRTSVQVTVFPGGGLNPTVTAVSQQVSQDTSRLVYSGPLFPTTPNFVTTVTMTLADNPSGNGLNGQYQLVADRVELSLISVLSNTSRSGTTTTNTTSGERGFGFFEWPLAARGTVDATSGLPNSSITNLDDISIQFLNAIGGSSVVPNRDIIAAVAHHSSGAVFLGGSFSTTFGSNIVAFKNSKLVSLSNGGLNGAVGSLVIEGNTLYVGGAFTDTISNSTSGKSRGITSYDVASDTWTPLQAGLNGVATSLNVVNGQVEIAGNFTNLLDSPGTYSGPSAGGFAVWDIKNNQWANSGGFLTGNMTFVGNSTGQEQILAGNVASSLRFGATGFVTVQNGNSKTGDPVLKALSVPLESSNGTSTALANRRRSQSTGWLSELRFTKPFQRRAVPQQLISTDPLELGPTILAGVFWTNSSDSRERVIIGGNFSFSTGSSTEFSNIAIYDIESGNIVGLPGSPVSGTVRALLVSGDTLYMGGDFTISGTNLNGFAIYDLDRQTLSMSGLNSLQNSGSNVTVRSITVSKSKPNTVIVAGTFSSAGGTNCVGICELDIVNRQWSVLGSGINGEVQDVAYGGDNQALLFASGSINLPDGTLANVAMFAFANSTWKAVGNGGDLPGPVTSLTIDDGNSSSIFAAGRSSDGTASFLTFWNGKSWVSINSGFDPSTNITQLSFVPLQDQHSANSIIEQDRMLFLSGMLVSSSFGNASSVLYDGQTFYPYIRTSTPNSSPGSISSLFSSIQDFSFAQHRFLAIGVVILISIAIAAGVVFLLVLIGVLWTLFARRESGKSDYALYGGDDDDSTHRPSSLLAHINAATRTTILGTSPFENNSVRGDVDRTGRTDAYAQSHDGDHFRHAETPLPIGNGGSAMEEEGRPARARFPFDAKEDGELPLTEGMYLEILDESNPQWWYARDPDTGREGVVPASYVM